MTLRRWTIAIALAALVLSVAMALFGSHTGDEELKAGALDILKVVAGGTVGALGVGIKST